MGRQAKATIDWMLRGLVVVALMVSSYFLQSTHQAIQANTAKINLQAIDIAEIKASRWTAKDASEDRRQIASMMSDLRHVSRQLADIKLALVEQRRMLDAVRLQAKSAPASAAP